MTLKTTTLAAIALALMAGSAMADDNGKGRGGKGMMGPRPDFTDLDANGDGQLSKEELVQFKETRFAKVDTNGDGELSIEEITASVQSEAPERAERMMEHLDEDNSGTISADEMPHADKDGGKRADKMIEHMDENGDGQISQEEFEAGKGRGHDRKGG